MRKTIIITLTLIVAFSAKAQTNFYVSTKGKATFSGRNWGLACSDLQTVINKTNAGDTVFVAAGVYRGGFYTKEGVTVLGGFTGNSQKPRERIYPGAAGNESQLSILEGNNQQRVITQLSGFNQPTCWEGFVIRNGRTSNQVNVGDAIYSIDGSNSIAGIIFQYNPDTREGMMISSQETKKQWGGYQKQLAGIDLARTADEAQTDLKGIENTAKIVASLGNSNMDFTSEDYPHNANYAANWCENIQTGGFTDWHLPSCGELQIAYNAKSRITNVMVCLGDKLQNGYWTSSPLGDLLSWTFYFESGLKVGALKYLEKNVRAVRSFKLDSTLEDINFAGAGALLNYNGVLMNCIVTENESASLGGGIYAGNGAQVLGCLVYNNIASKSGSGIYAYSHEGENAALVLNSTIVNNKQSTGLVLAGLQVEAINCIVWGNTNHEGNAENIYGTGTISFSAIENGTANNNNITDNPLFNNFLSGNFDLNENSPCLKKGNVDAIILNSLYNKDLSGYTRVIFQGDNSFADMGAFQQGETDHFLSNPYTKQYLVKCWPNPVKSGENLYILAQDYENKILELLNASGKTLLSLPLASAKSIITAPANKGTYYIRIGKLSNTNVAKFIVE